jgi:hypothetical protein
MKAQKKPDAGGTRREHSHGKDKDFQPIGRNTSLLKLAEAYSTSFNEFCSGFPPCTPTQYLFDLHDIAFKAKHLKTDKSGRLRWEI